MPAGEATDPGGHLAEVDTIARTLTTLGLDPILVGGMALVILGSRRVTRDYDLVIAHPAAEGLARVMDVFYARGFELASRLNEAGDVTVTLDNARVATIRLRLDAPSSAYFYHWQKRLRIDLLFDFPIPAASLARHATRLKVGSHVVRIASEADLLRLKKIALARRSFAGDAQDIEFLEARRRRKHAR